MSRGFLALPVSVMVACAVGCQPAQPVPAVAPAPAPAIQPTTPGGPGADRTFDYWSGALRVQSEAAAELGRASNGKPDEIGKFLIRVAILVESQPAVGVDPDAIEAVHGLAESLRRVGGSLVRLTDGGTSAVAVLRVLLFGDPAVFGEQAADARDLRTFVETAAANARKTRALLSSRYGREFEPLDSPPKRATEPSVVQAAATHYRLFNELEPIPHEQELRKLKAKIADLEREEGKLKNVLAKAIVEHDNARRDAERIREAVATGEATLKARGEAIETLTDEKRKAELTERLNADLKRHVAQKKQADTAEATLTALEQQKKQLSESLDLLTTARRGHQDSVDTLEVELRVLDPNRKYEVDNTKLDKIRKELEELGKKTDLKREEQKLRDGLSDPNR